MEEMKKPRARMRTMERVRIREIAENPYQPREEFDGNALNGLIQSIRENGLICPVTLRRTAEGGYMLIAGERRIRALKALGRNWVDAVILEADEAESRMFSLIENIQREQLNVFEEASGMREILRTSGMSQEALSRRLGRNPSTIANRLRLLKLPEDVRAVILRAGLTERHARALLKLDGDRDRQLALALYAEEKELTVKKLEALVDKEAEEKKHRKAHMKTVLRDRRMFINAVKETVKSLNEAGLPAVSRVEETEEEVNIIITLTKG